MNPDWQSPNGDIQLYRADCLGAMNAMPQNSVDLVFGSPPYCDARTYGIGATRNCIEWIEWMLTITAAAARVCRGPVIWVAAGVTRKRNYWPACEGLMWEWWQRGGTHELYRPCIYHRIGIPGSGGTDWFRADTEYIMCFKRPGPLAWADNIACGHPPKWVLGGEMSHRRSKNGQRPLERGNEKGSICTLPKIANPGNLIHCNVGGGVMGHLLVHENEAPFPEELAKRFILSCCPPDGIVLDPFCGSGTTLAVAWKHHRRGVGIDVRRSQIELTKRRLTAIALPLLEKLEEEKP